MKRKKSHPDSIPRKEVESLYNRLVACHTRPPGTIKFGWVNCDCELAAAIREIYITLFPGTTLISSYDGKRGHCA